jgi:hypothetical protein
VIHEGLCIRAFNKDLSHVGDIEHTHVLPYGKVLLHDTGILDGHNEACKGTHLGPKGHVRIIQAGFQF